MMTRTTFIVTLCAVALASATPAMAQARRTNPNGATIYARTCMRCHNPPDPASFTDVEWRSIMAQMRARANLTRAEAQAVLEYLQSANGGRGPAGAPQTSGPAPSGAVRPGAIAGSQACPPISKSLVATGQQIFETGGNCSACHGPNAGGTMIAPDLKDSKWLNISGSYASIDSLVTRGVPHPKRFPGVMPPMGGANLSRAQVCSVAAYVYSLSH